MTQDDVAAARAVFAQRLRPRRDDVAPTVLGAGHDDLEPGREYLAALADGGWLTPTWPREYGGRGLTPTEAGAILRELDAFETPDLYPYLVGLHVVAPTLLAVATKIFLATQHDASVDEPRPLLALGVGAHPE